MMDGSKYRSKGYGMAGAGKRLPYVVLLLLLALAAGGLSVVVLHKARERRAFAVLLKERDRQVVSLRILLQKEKAYNKEMKRKVEELKATTSSLRTQKTDLKTKLKGLEAASITLKNTQKELESSLTERDSRINQMEEKATILTNTQKKLEASLTERDSRINQMEEYATILRSTHKKLEASLTERDRRINQMEEKAIAGSNTDQMAALMEILQQKEAELEEIKTRFQDHSITDRKVATRKSTPLSAQQNNVSRTSHIVVAEKVTNPSHIAVAEKVTNSSHIAVAEKVTNSSHIAVAEKVTNSSHIAVAGKVTNSSNTTILATSEEKISGNTIVIENNHQKQKVKSSEGKPVKLTSNTAHDDTEDKTDDFFEDIDDIYGESHSRKSQNKKVLTNRHVDSLGEELDGIGQQEHSLDQDSDGVRHSKLLEKEYNEADGTKKKNSTNGGLGSKDSSSVANEKRPKQAVPEMAGAADIKPKMSANDDGTQQQNKRHKKKKSRSKKKKMADIATINDDGEITKEKQVDTTMIPE